MSHIIDDDDGASIVTRLLFSTALDLSAKAFAQPIGVEDNWDDLGDGVVEISAQNTLRVVRQLSDDEIKQKIATIVNSNSMNKKSKNGKNKRNKSNKKNKDKGENKEDADQENNSNNKTSSSDETNPESETSLLDEVELERDSDILDVEAAAMAASAPDILIEDHISEEIPLVGKDSCIVWNSPTHDMSFCIMFTSECGYAAVWSAVHLLQGKTDIPSLEWDYLQSFRNMEQQELKDMGSSASASNSNSNSSNDSNIPKPPQIVKKKTNSKERDGGEEPSRNTPVLVPGSEGGSNNNNGERDSASSTAAAGNQNSDSTAASPNNNNNNSNAASSAEGMEDLAESVRPAQNEETVVIDVSESSTIEQLAQSGRERSQQQFASPDRNRTNDDDDENNNNKDNNDNDGQTQNASSPSIIKKDVHEVAFDKIAEAFAEAVRHVSSMSFVHRHCVAQSFIEGQCATTTRWGLRGANVAQGLFSLFHPGLIFYFLDETDVFTQLVKVLSTDNEAGFNNKSKTEQEKLLRVWVPPSVLPETTHNIDIGRSLNRAMRLSVLRHELVVPGTEECVLTFLETLQQQELHSVLASVTENEDFIRDLVAVIGNAESSPAKVEGAIRCVADIIQNAVALLPREMMMPMIARIDEAGIVDAVERLAERILDMASKEKTATPLIAQNVVGSNKTEEHPIMKMLNALSHLFEASVVNLNSRAEEAIVGGLWRKPLMTTSIVNSNNNKKQQESSSASSTSATTENLQSVNAILRLLALWSRITSSSPPSPTPSPPRKDASATKGPQSKSSQLKQEKLQAKYTSGLHRGGTFYLYHLCGLHDDEGHTVDRSSDIGVVADREKFQLHVATQVVPLMLQHQSAAVGSSSASSNNNINISPTATGKQSSMTFPHHHQQHQNQQQSLLPTTQLLQRSPIVTSSELTFFESMFDWATGTTLKKMLKSIVAAPSVLPALLAATNNNNNNSNSNSPNNNNNTTSCSASAKLPSHVLCARVRMIRSIFQALTKTDSIFDEIVSSSSANENNKDKTGTGKPPRIAASSGSKNASDSLESSTSTHPLGLPTKQQLDENKAFANSIVYRLTFDFDVMNPILAASSAIATTAMRRAPLLVSSMNALLSQIKTASNLYPLRRFLRIRHSRLLPEEFRTYVELEEEHSLREDMITATANNLYGGGGMMNMITGSTNAVGASNSVGGLPSLLENSTLSVMSNSASDSLSSTSPSTTAPGSKKNTILFGGPNIGMNNANSNGVNINNRQSPVNTRSDSLSNSPINTFSVGGAQIHSSGSLERTSPNDGVSPGRRPLLVDAEIPPPRSPENIPLVKRRSPSPEQHTHLKFDIGAMASPGKNNSSDHHHNNHVIHQHQHHGHNTNSATSSSSNSNTANNNNGIQQQPLGSRRIAVDSNVHTPENKNSILKPSAPTQPRKPSSQNSQSPRANSLGSSNQASSSLTPSTSAPDYSSSSQTRAGSAEGGSRRPSSRGGRPKSGGGLRSKSPISGLTGSSLMRN